MLRRAIQSQSRSNLFQAGYRYRRSTLLEPSEFQSLLCKGLGRAVVHLLHHDAAPYRDLILHACTHNLAFDWQIEAARGQYLFDLIHATGDPEPYRNHAMAALTTLPAEECPVQLYQLARLFAQEGDGGAKRALYAAYAAHALEQDFSAAEELVYLDGLDGFLFAAERFLRSAGENDLHVMEACLEALEERDGKEATAQALERAGRDLPEVAGLLERIEALRAEYEARRNTRTKSPRITYTQVRQRILADGRQGTRGLARRFGIRASEEELKAAAADLCAETDPDRRLATLDIFWKQAYPGDPALLMQLVRDPDRRTAHAALQALCHTTGPNIRAFALQLCDEPRWHPAAADLLAANYEIGDFATMEQLLAAPHDDDELHWLGRSVRELAVAQPTPEAILSLLLLYKRDPCSVCREHCVEMLIQLGGLSEELRFECQFDCCSDTREAVRARAI